MGARPAKISPAEQEQRYREAMAARRAGEPCTLCGTIHSALSSCPVPTPQEARSAMHGLTPTPPPSARNTDPETSKEAAALDKRALRFVCLRFYAEHPDGLVDDDLAALGGHPDGHESYRRRGSDLRALGWTAWLFNQEEGKPETAEPVRRKTSLGASARVAVITPLGRSVLEEQTSDA